MNLFKKISLLLILLSVIFNLSAAAQTLADKSPVIKQLKIPNEKRAAKSPGNTDSLVPITSGSVNVGVGQTYTSLTNAGGVFNEINNGTVTGDIIVNITSDLTAETGTFALNQYAAPHTILIRPTPNINLTPTISGSNAGCLIRLNGADRVTINGANTIAGSTRDLTIRNTNAGTSSAVVCFQSLGAGAGATNNRIINTNVAGNSSSTTLFGVMSGSTTISLNSLGANNDFNQIANNKISRVQYGIFTSGVSAANNNLATSISQNQINSPAPDNVGVGGIFARFEDSLNILENDIGGMNVSSGSSPTAFGIAVGIIPNNTFTAFGSNENNGGALRQNRIGSVVQNGGGSAFGIFVSGRAIGSLDLSNNMISGVSGNSTGNDFTAGILIGGGIAMVGIYHNSVSMTGTRGAATSNSYAMAYPAGDMTIDIRENILYNTQTSSSTGKSYAIGTGSTTFVNLTSDWNDLFVTGVGTHIGRTGGLGTAAGTDRTTLANWKTATAKDTNSVSSDPLFISTTDLHIKTGSPVINFTGAPVLFNGDFDNEARNSPRDLGADEYITFSPLPLSGTFYNLILNSNTGATLSGNVTVNGQLTLQNGIINTNGFTLTVACDGNAAAYGVNYVDGTVRKDFCAPQPFTFPVGKTVYSPVTANVTALGVNPSSLTVNATDAFMTGVNTANSVSRYWTLTETGAITSDLSFVYDNSDVNGNEALYKVMRRSGGMTISSPSSTNNAATNTASIIGVSNFSDWSVGLPLAVAASVNIGGRVMLDDGITGVPRATLTLVGGSLAQPLTIRTNPFGFYNFENLEVGQTYIVTVHSKQFTFTIPTRVFTPNDNIMDADFIAFPQ